jgi:hypothetical protein
MKLKHSLRLISALIWLIVVGCGSYFSAYAEQSPTFTELKAKFLSITALRFNLTEKVVASPNSTESTTITESSVFATPHKVRAEYTYPTKPERIKDIEIAQMLDSMYFDDGQHTWTRSSPGLS